MQCGQCGKDVKIQMFGYGQIFCSIECFREAGKTYKPKNERNRGGGVGKDKVTI